MKRILFLSLFTLAIMLSSALTITAKSVAKQTPASAVGGSSYNIDFTDLNGAISASWPGSSLGGLPRSFLVRIWGYYQTIYYTTAIAIQIPGILPPGETITISISAGGSPYAEGSYTRPAKGGDKLMGTITGTSESEEIPNSDKEILWKLSVSQQTDSGPTYQSFVVCVYDGTDNKSRLVAQQNLMAGGTVNFSFIVAPDAVYAYFIEVRPVESSERYANGLAYYVRPSKGYELIWFTEGGAPH